MEASVSENGPFWENRKNSVLSRLRWLLWYLVRPGNACCFSMKRSDERVIRYLKGETVSLTEERQDSDAWPKNGWILVCVDGWPLGWAKNAGAVLKNKYYPDGGGNNGKDNST